MPYQVEYEERAGYLYARVAGERSLAAIIELARELLQKALELHQPLILVDVRELKGWLQVMESNYIVTTEFPRLKGQGLKRVAILDRENPEGSRWFFFETVAQNRGFEIRVSSNMESALGWLLE